MQKIQYLPLESLKLHPDNPRTIKDDQFKKLCKSIKDNADYFETRPILCNKDMVIFAGNMRWRAAKEVGMKEVPVAVMDIPEERQREIMIRDNHENGIWDFDQLSKMFDFNELVDWGFDRDNLKLKFSLLSDAKEDDFDPEGEYKKIATPVTKLGDLYHMGDHRLLCGSSTSHEDFERLMGGGKGHMVFTDPPYSVDYRPQKGKIDHKRHVRGYGDEGIFNDAKSDPEAIIFYTEILKLLYEFTTKDCPIYWWLAMNKIDLNLKAFEDSGWKTSQTIIWLKNYMTFSRGVDYHRQYEPCLFGWKKKETHFRNKGIQTYKDVFNLDYQDFNELFDVWYEKRDNVADYVHPTQKPVRLAERALKKSSRNEDIVIDAFGGSGSTLICCQQMDRKGYIMELDPKYCDVIVKRWEQFTGERATKVSVNVTEQDAKAEN